MYEADGYLSSLPETTTLPKLSECAFNLIRESKKTIYGKNIAVICEDYIKWFRDNYNNDTNTVDLAYVFICKEILEISEINFDCHFNDISESDLDSIINNIIVTKYGENNFSSIGWLMSVCVWLNESGFAYVSQKYILPCIDNVSLKPECSNTRIRYKIIESWFNSCIGFSRHLMTFIHPDVISLFNKKVLSFEDKLQLVKSESFSDVLKTPCKGFGNSLYSFLESGRTDNVSNHDEIAQNNASEKNHLINYLKTNSNEVYEPLLMVSIIFLFADEQTDIAVEALIRHFDLISRHKHSSIPRIALIKSFYAEKNLFVKSELYNMIKREYIRSRKKYLKDGEKYSENDDRIFSDSLMNVFQTEMYHCVLKEAQEIVSDINKQSRDIAKKLESPNLSNEDKKELNQKEAELKNKMDKLGNLASLFGIKTAHYYENMLDKSVQDFYKSIKKNKADAKFADMIYGVLSGNSAEEVMSYLRLSELQMDFQIQLKALKWQNKIDYTAPVLCLTKALEYIGNLIFKKLVSGKTYSNLSQQDKITIQKYYSKTDNNGQYDWADYITLGNVGYMFRKSNSKILGISNMIDTTRLISLNGKVAYSDGNRDYKFKHNSNANLDLIGKAIGYVTTNYRNLAAHKDRTQAQKYKECKDLLITGKHLLWILLYILNVKL